MTIEEQNANIALQNEQRANFNLPPLPFVTEEGQEQKQEEGEKEKEEEKAPEEKKEALSNEDKQASEQPKEAAPAPVVNDDALLSLLKERGLELASLEDLKEKIAKSNQPTEEELKKQKAKRESDKLVFGLQENLVSREEYDAYVKDISSPEAMVYDDWAASELAEDSELTDEDLHQRFREEFHLDTDKNSNAYKKGQRALRLYRDELINGKYGKIKELDTKFNAHEANQNNASAFAKKVSTETPAYNTAINSAIDQLKKVTVNIGDEQAPDMHDFEYPQEMLNEVKDLFLSDDRRVAFIRDGWNANTLKDIIDNTLWHYNKSKIISHIAKKHAGAEIAKLRKEQRGIQSNGENSNITDNSGEEYKYSSEHAGLRSTFGLETKS